MSFANFLFGNIGEDGQLEDFDLGDDVRESLSRAVERRGGGTQNSVLDSLFASQVLTGPNLPPEPSRSTSAINPALQSSIGRYTPGGTTPRPRTPREGPLEPDEMIQPVADAIDFSDFNELADDAILTEENFNRGLYAVHTPLLSPGQGPAAVLPSREVDEDYDLERPPVASSQETTVTPVGVPTAQQDESLISTPKRKGIPPDVAGLLGMRIPGVVNDEDTLENLFQSPPLHAVADEISPALVPVLDEQLAPEPGLELAHRSPPNVRDLYPGFEPHKILKFTELLLPRLERTVTLKKRKVLSSREELEIQTLPDQQAVFDNVPLSSRSDSPSFLDRKSLTVETSHVGTEDGYVLLDSSSDSDVEDPGPSPPVVFDQAATTLDEAGRCLNIAEWDRRIQWDSATVLPDQLPPEHDIMRYYNPHLADANWVDSVIWDTHRPHKPFTQLILDPNDPQMLFEPMHESAQEKAAKRRALRAVQDQAHMAMADEAEQRKQLQHIDKFNLSNDFFYVALQEGKVQRVRQTFGQLDLQHSIPAQKLQPPLYKTKVSKTELRTWHRPPTIFPVQRELTFSKLKPGKKKHKRKLGGEALKTTKDITLKDNVPFVLFEFSEEYPPVMSNVGMGSLLLNYYRKQDAQDQANVSLDIGELFVLDTADTSPFYNFGDVNPGQTIPALYNNMLRAPLFRHQVKPTDFLLIQSTYKDSTKFFLREIPYLFTVGQTYPVQEVPGPHSRKVTHTLKGRLQAIAYRLLRRNPYHRLHMSKVAKYFPEYSELHIRMRLKEFMEFQRKGNNSGFWKLKPTIPLPSEDEIRKLLTPEMMCLYESMLVGECHLRDAGYGRSLDGDEARNEESESKLSTEEQLAPWIITRNFINAIQGKAMLRLYGDGDPTGRGEGFSFIRVSMKDIFLRAGETAAEKLAEIEARPKSAHRYNVAEQQQIYREEITRIWNAQFKALSSPQEPEISEDDEDYAPPYLAAGPGVLESLYSETRGSTPYPASTLTSQANSPTPSVDRSSLMDLDDTTSVTSKTSYFPATGPPKMLVIRRVVRSPATGELTWQSEVVKDPHVIGAYLKQRKVIEAEPTTASTTGGHRVSADFGYTAPDPHQRQLVIKRRIQNRLKKLHQRRERRLAKEKVREAQHMSTISLPHQSKPKKETVRRCGNCGQLGHMKTNRKCPKFNEMMAHLLSPK
ncbi:hypothetical protein IWQ62_000295 [Dispira parvispora]|uniref:Transcription initiation factor TFIID subunit 1 histone acetyltransferase domain-containing protein n=1 Tax=Dispira parvispora TaxID=1520584 RepID=A0A9W8B1M1_9FUNG|nr:hypothetical protein IWQ62_000295 [Dispira parvispora]